MGGSWDRVRDVARHPDGRRQRSALFPAGAQACAGDRPDEWTPRELRHSFVSLLSASGLRIEDIAILVGHRGTRVTEQVYPHELRPIIQTGATAMDSLFDWPPKDAGGNG
jgi:integrase